MGAASSREIEEQLEAALALLDAARSKQDALRSENDALQARITAQAASLLLHEDASKAGGGGAVHLMQQREPLSKRVLASMAIVACLAAHLLDKGLGLRRAMAQVELVEAQATAQGLCLCAVFALLLRYRRYKWRRIRPDRIIFRRGSGRSGHRSTRASPRRHHRNLPDFAATFGWIRHALFADAKRHLLGGRRSRHHPRNGNARNGRASPEISFIL